MTYRISRLSNWLRLAIIAGAMLGMGTINLDCARADSEEKDLIEAKNHMLAGEECAFRRLDWTWMNTPGAKYKASWFELHSWFNLYYGNSPDLTKIETAVKLEPNNPHIVATYAISLLVDRRRDKCLKIANLAVQLDPKDHRAKSIQAMCQACYGDTKVSKSDVLALIEKGGPLLEPYIGAAQFFILRFDRAGQLAAYDAMVKNNSKSAWAYCRRGIDLRHKGSYERAIADLTKSLELSPKSDEALRNLAEVYYKTKKYAECIKAYNRLEKLEKTSMEAFGAGLANRAECYAHLNKHENAVVDYTAAIAWYGVAGTPLQQLKTARTLAVNQKHNLFDWLIGRAASYRELGKFDQALGDLKVAGILFPSEYDVLEGKERIHRKQGKIEEALTETNDMISMRPHLASGYRERAEILDKLGRKAESAKDTKMANDIEANSGKLNFRNIYIP